MVARDPVRKVTLTSHPEFNDKKKGADRYGDPHVGSTSHINDDVKVEEQEPVRGRASSDKDVKSDSKKKG